MWLAQAHGFREAEDLKDVGVSCLTGESDAQRAGEEDSVQLPPEVRSRISKTLTDI